MSASARLLIIDPVIIPGDPTAADAVYTDLIMLTLLKGKERSALEFESLAREAGFTINKLVRLSTATISILELQKADL
ncbi:hypothetical protein F3J22_23320 [Chitinophaga sp. Cy-1792]|nr:methyltransferase [Chitinophaga sp. Cy-1792]NIG56430.1 hypothetical protein [Chitinophaga sp. Cy-1792]